MFFAALLVIARNWKQVNMYINRRINKENVVVLYNRIPISRLKIVMMKFTGKWMEL